MSQRGVQLVIGKLLTDAGFLERFTADGGGCLLDLRQKGIDLTEIEIAALVGTDPRVWSKMALELDRRLRDDFKRAHLRRHGQLTARQQHVLAGVCEGLSNKEIAAGQGVSEGAVKATLQQLFHKTRVRRRAQLVRVAIENALVAPQIALP